MRRECGLWGARLIYPTSKRPTSPATTHSANKLAPPPLTGRMLLSMSRDFIAQLYADTPCWLWPVLWIEIYWMQTRLARLPDADDPKDLYEVRLNDWGQLQLIKLYSHVETPDPNAWKSGSQLDSDLFATDAYLVPYLRRMPESQTSTLMGQVHEPVTAHLSTRSRPTLGTRSLGPESLYLDPG